MTSAGEKKKAGRDDRGEARDKVTFLKWSGETSLQKVKLKSGL